MVELSLSDPNNPIWSKLDQILAMDNTTTSFTVGEQDDATAEPLIQALKWGRTHLQVLV
jgi:hypothetical protein